MTEREALEEAVRLYDSYGLLATTDSHLAVWRWINGARAALAATPAFEINPFANEPPATPGREPAGWLHQIKEPDGGSWKMYSASSDNPWSHWVQEHKDKCTYTATPLYAAQPASPLRGMDLDLIALDAAHQIEALPTDLHEAQKTARIQLIVLHALHAALPEQPAADPDIEARITVLSEALKSISKNTCCDNCREAALVARSALASYIGLARETAAAPVTGLTGCLHPGNEPLSCQYEGQCLSVSCNHNGKTWVRPRMTLEAQDPNVLYPNNNEGK